MWRPYTLPVGPTRLADSRTSIPPPDPRSNTVSPSSSVASAVGFPQPRDASTASTGSPAFCRPSYKSAVIGSHASVVAPQHALDPQQLPSVVPSVTLSAAPPYFFFTSDFRASSASVRFVGIRLQTRFIDGLGKKT